MNRSRVATIGSALAFLLVLRVAYADAPPPRPGLEIPAHNDAHLASPAPRPPAGDAVERARTLFDAIVHDTPESAHAFFFPREPFLVLKGIADPGGYHAILLRHYDRDIHALHASLGDLQGATFDGFDLSRQATWMTVHREANALPYWSAYHSHIRYRVGGLARTLEVRVVITWDDHWYVTHLQ